MSFNIHYIRTHDFSSFAGGNNGEGITRDNYEAFFVMYVDNELQTADRMAVEAFVQQNPDLEEELVMLKQSVLQADEQIVFEPKETLLKNTSQELVNENNYEAYFVLYGDDELTNEEKDKVEQFVYKHPQYQETFELIQQVKLLPDKTLTFADKACLYRTEENDNKVVAFTWWRIAVAAIILLVTGSLGWYLSTGDNNTSSNGNIAVTKYNNEKNNKLEPATKSNSGTGKAIPENTVASVTEPVVAENKLQTPVASVKQPVQQIRIPVNDKKNVSKPRNIPLAVNVSHKNTEQPPASEPGRSINITAKPVLVAVTSSYTRPAVTGKVIKSTVKPPVTVATIMAEPETRSKEIDEPIYIATTTINKTPLRGFFRQVSRAVDKVTNPDENDKGTVRIASFEIAIK